MSHNPSFKVIKRLDEKVQARMSTACPVQHKNLSLLIATQCAHYGHPKIRGEENTCYCQQERPISE